MKSPVYTDEGYTPSLVAQQRKRRPPPSAEDIEEDDEYYTSRPTTSARRYAMPAPGEYQVGNKRVHVRYTETPKRRASLPAPQTTVARPRLHFHWLVWVGLALFIMLAGYMAINSLGAWWQHHLDDVTYGNPRTYQTDAVVGHDDSSSQPTHFIAMNLRGQIIVAEFPGGDITKARSYSITTIPGNDTNPPAILKFVDLNGDGKLDMEVLIGDPGSQVTMFLFNTGTTFASKV